jgi:hypothetical protein
VIVRVVCLLSYLSGSNLTRALARSARFPEGDGARGGSGFVVHNSPMTTPELQAVNFARTVR